MGATPELPRSAKVTPFGSYLAVRSMHLHPSPVEYAWPLTPSPLQQVLQASLDGLEEHLAVAAACSFIWQQAEKVPAHSKATAPSAHHPRLFMCSGYLVWWVSSTIAAGAARAGRARRTSATPAAAMSRMPRLATMSGLSPQIRIPSSQATGTEE